MKSNSNTPSSLGHNSNESHAAIYGGLTLPAATKVSSLPAQVRAILIKRG